jgi:glycosyltransferase involved in cell wall biosynthesis
MINVLHTVRSLRVDGVVKVVLRNVSHLDTRDFRHHVCSILPDDQLAGEYREHGIEPIFAGYRGIASAPASVLRLTRIIRQLQIDVVHANRTLDLVVAGAAAKLCRVPVVSSLHWLGRPEDHPEDERPMWWQRIEKALPVAFNRLLATRIVAVSGAVRDSFAVHPGFPVSRTEVVYPGLNMGTGAPASSGVVARLKRELGIASANPVLLNVGRLEPVKGQRHLLPMMRIIRNRFPDAKLLIAGGGALERPLSDQIEQEDLADAIQMLGSRSDVNALLAASDLLVLASESEAAPLPPMEAMRAGKPVVATAVGGIPEIVEDGVSGYVVPRADPEALAAAVLKVFDEPGKAERMGAEGRQIALERFEIGKSVRDLERIYRSVLKGAGARLSPGQPNQARRRKKILVRPAD